MPKKKKVLEVEAEPVEIMEDPKLTNEPAGSYPEVKPDYQAIENNRVKPQKKDDKVYVFAMTGGSINPIIDGKRVNIRSEKVGVKQVQVDGGVGWVDIYRYETKNVKVAEWLREQGYQED